MISIKEAKGTIEPNKGAEVQNGETVRGSGFTYDEARDHTEDSIPIDKAQDDEIVDLPDLGKPNRPNPGQ